MALQYSVLLGYGGKSMGNCYMAFQGGKKKHRAFIFNVQKSEESSTCIHFNMKAKGYFQESRTDKQ
jgi:hypothetical protein